MVFFSIMRHRRLLVVQRYEPLSKKILQTLDNCNNSEAYKGHKRLMKGNVVQSGPLGGG